MSNEKILDEILLPLADAFETFRKGRGVQIGHDATEEYEVFRETIAEQIVLGFINRVGQDSYQLTNEGYANHLPRIKELRSRTLAQSQLK